MGPAKPEWVSVVSALPNIRAVRAEKDRCIAVTWKGGEESIIDLSQHLATYAVFAPLRGEDDLFLSARVGEWGWCVHWSEDMEISADTLWRLALQQGAEWLRGWRTGHRMTQAEAAKALGVSPRMWRYYEAGSHLLPKTVRLAAFGFDVQVQAA
jgi:hypothetical protein